MTNSKSSPTKEHLRLTFREVQASVPERPPTDSESTTIIEKMVEDLHEALPGMLTDLSSSGRRWARGKSEQEVARAKEILSHAIDRIGRLALDEKEQQHRQRLEAENSAVDIKVKETDMYLSALERAVKIAKDLSSMGIEVDIKHLLEGLAGPQRKGISTTSVDNS